MDAWIDIRRKARGCHQKALTKTMGDRSAAALIKAALDINDLELRCIDLGPGTLGSLDRSARLISVAKNLEQATEHLVVAHEIGHFTLHDDPSNEVTGLQQGLGGDPVDSGAGTADAMARF